MISAQEDDFAASVYSGDDSHELVVVIWNSLFFMVDRNDQVGNILDFLLSHYLSEICFRNKKTLLKIVCSFKIISA